ALQPRYPSRPVFTLHRRIENVPSSEVIGYLSIDVSLTALTDIVDQLYNKEREKIFIVDENGDLIYADEQSKLGEPLQESWYSGVISASGRTSGNFEQDGSLFIYNKIAGKGMKWTIVKQIPVSYLVREANHAAGINLLLLAVSLIVIAAATIIISVRITAPIKQLGKYMNQIQSGNLNVDIQPASNDEI